MSSDYDSPRKRPGDDEAADDLATLRITGSALKAEVATDDEANLGEDLELPGADLSDEELSVTVVPKQKDEFSCSRCFLVIHLSQRDSAGPDICRDCA
jgi:hypothetical protein